MSVRLRPRGSRQIWLADAFLAAAAAFVFTRFIIGGESYRDSLHLPSAILAALFFLAEVNVVHVQFRRETQTFSLTEIPLILGLFFVTPTGLVAAQLVGAAAALILHRRQPLVKWTYNLGAFVLSTSVASIVFRALANPHTRLLSHSELAASYAAAGAAILVGTAAVWLAVWILEGRPHGRLMVRSMLFGGLGAVTNTTLALMGVVILRVNPHAAWIITVPALTVLVAYRGYTSQKRQHDSLRRLADASRVVQQSIEVEPATKSVLGLARDLLNAEIADVTLFPKGEGEPAIEARLGPASDAEIWRIAQLDPTKGVWANVAAEGRARVVPRPIQDPELRRYYAVSGIRDVMAAPLIGRDGTFGVLRVANRRGDVQTFTSEDLSLFETFTTNVAASLENVRLVARLQESLDTTTGQLEAKREVLTVLSHELRNPLTALMGSVSLAANEDVNPVERRAHLQLMTTQVEQMRSLVEDLLMDAQLNGGVVRAIQRRVALADVAGRVVAACSPWTTNHTLAVAFDNPWDVIVTDPDIVHRILCNVVSNAAKNSPPGSSITIGGGRLNGGTTLSVSDTGVGIPPDLHDRIFERFVHSERVDGQPMGMGLGLSICRRLADVCGARLRLARSAPGEGSEFELWIPDAAHPATSRAEVVEAPPDDAFFSGERDPSMTPSPADR